MLLPVRFVGVRGSEQGKRHRIRVGFDSAAQLASRRFELLASSLQRGSVVSHQEVVVSEQTACSDPRYRVVQIPKGRGKFRPIYVPTRARRAELRLLVGKVAALARKADKAGVQHGFTKRRSPVTCAAVHVGHEWTWTADLSGAFDSIGEQHLKGKLPKELMAEVLVDGAPRQGLPTSPAVCNLALAALDEAIVRWGAKAEKQFVFTRYADDLTISGDDPEVLDAVRVKVPQIVSGCGFKLAAHKTRSYLARGGMRPVVGVNAGPDDVSPTRAAKRKLRAARHQEALGVEGAADSARGLAEWCKLTPPKQHQRSALGGDVSPEDELAAVARVWKVGLPKAAWPEKKEVWLSSDVVVTGDPVMMLGMSTWTTGWRSCMAQPSGSHRAGTKVWCALKGTRIAALLSSKTEEIAGVTRRAMRARALVHELRDSRLVRFVFDRIYGNPGDVDELRAALVCAGMVGIHGERNKIHPTWTVVGNVPRRGYSKKPYCDSLVCSPATERGEAGKSREVWLFKVR